MNVSFDLFFYFSFMCENSDCFVDYDFHIHKAFEKSKHKFYKSHLSFPI